MQPHEDLAVDQHVGPGEPVVVTAERVSAFADALPRPADRPAAAGPDRSGAAGVAAPTMVVALALASAGGPADLLWPQVAAGRAGGVVHGDQQLTVHCPVRAGDRLVFASRVATVRRLPGAMMTAIATSVTSGDGAPVADLTATFVLTDPA
jgi:acyl dehydratase